MPSDFLRNLIDQQSIISGACFLACRRTNISMRKVCVAFKK